MDEDSENLPMANVNVKEMLTALNKANKLEKDRQVAYTFLASSLESQKDTTKIIQQYATQLFKYLSRDVLSQEHGLVTVVSKIIQYCVKDKFFLERVTKDDAEELFLAILKAGKENQNQEVTKQLLSILGQQRLPSEIVSSQMSAVLDMLEFIYTEGNGKAIHGINILEALISLHERMAADVSQHAYRWCKMVLPCLGHALPSVRVKSFDLLKDCKSSLEGNSEIGKFVLKTVDNGLAKVLISLVVKNPQYAMDVWSFVMDVAGKAIHKGSTINVMLEIIEIGFKGSQESRIVSFKAWSKLVDNFALDQDVISDAKRIRLVMMVLKTNNAKTEPVALEKLHTWWHFARSVGNKLPSVLEQIIYPLLQFCVGSLNQQSQSACPSPSFALKMSSPCASKALANIHSRMGSQQLPSFPALQKIGFEVIGHLVSRSGDFGKAQGVKWTLDPLPHEMFASSANFVKHAPTILSSLETLLKSIGSEDREVLVVHIWSSLSAHLKIAIEKGGKADCRDVFGAFLSLFHSLVQADYLQPQILVTMFQSMSDFPYKVLSSSLYMTGAGTAVKGCPALLLCEILFMPAFLKVSREKEVYLRLFSGIVNAGASKQQGALNFIQAVADILDSAFANLASADDLYRLWNILALALLDFVTKTNEVNQGDALEYNFGCLYAVLLIPVQHQLASKVSQSVCKAMLRTWKELYHSFARLSALVANAEANVCLEEISAKIIGMWRAELKEAANLEFLASLCVKMLDCADFSAISVGRKQNSFTLSPSKWTKRRQRPLANLHSFVHLLGKMQTESNTLLDHLGGKAFFQKQAGSPNVLLSYTNLVVDVYTHLFTHLPGAVVTHVLSVLAPPMARLFSNNGGTGGVKMFVPSVMSKLEKLWFEMCNCVTGRFSDQYDSSFLASLSPLLEVTFPHFRRAIKSQTLTFWSATFSKSIGLTYPDSLKPVLSAIKEKTAIVLPGWITIDDNVIAETPFTEISQSLASQGESQVPVPVLPGLPSPKRPQKGSFLTKDLSPARKSPAAGKASPAKVISPKDAKKLFSSRRNISTELNMMSDKDFVVITSPTKKKRVLTEHQKEVLKEKRVMPVMYNNLDASQDTSLMAHLNVESQESMSCMDVIVIDSQASQGKEKVSSLAVRDSSSSGAGFAAPKRLKVPSRRRSTRIQEMSNDADYELINNHKEGPSKKSQKPTIKESENPQDGAGGPSDQQQLIPADGNDRQNADGVKDIEDHMVLSSLEAPMETPPSFESSSSPSDKVEVPAFGMFRTRNSSSNNAEPNKVNMSTTPSTPDMKPRRVSLRKIKSQGEEMSVDAPTVPEEKGPESNKGKSPRRVPLQRIHDHKSSNQNDKASAKPESKKEEDTTLSQGDKTQQESEVVVESQKPKSNLDKWLAKSNPPKTMRRESPRKKRKLSEVEEERSPVVPITLVEDTQSPGKMGRPSHHSSSIAETPVKSDDSPSPAIRSVRKLFADDGPDDALNTNKTITCDTPKTHEVKSTSSNNDVSPASVAGTDEMENLSQGFVTITQEESHAVASQQKNESSISKEKNEGSNVQEMSQSENLFASSEETADSMEPLMALHMPTLSSQTNGVQSCKSDSSISSRTSSSVESDPKDKTMSGTESEFDPSQATLREECNQTTSVVAKKSAVVRDTLASTRTRRSNAKRAEITDKALTKSKCIDSVSVPVDNTVSNVNQMEIESGDKNVEKVNVPNTATEQGASEKNPVSELGASESQKEGLSPLEMGEVTPVIKAASENPQSQRCSTTKKKRLMAKQLAEQRDQGSDSSIEAPSKTERSEIKSERVKRKLTKKVVDWNSTSSTKRKISPSVSPPSVRSRHMLRIRTRAVKKLSQSPPAKRRKFEKKDVSIDLDSSMDDDQTLASLIKGAKSQSMSEVEKETAENEKVVEIDVENEEVAGIDAESVKVTEMDVSEAKLDEDDSEDQPLASLVSTNTEGKQAEIHSVTMEEDGQQNENSKVQAELCQVSVVDLSQDQEMEVVEVNSIQSDHDYGLVQEAEQNVIDKECCPEEMPSTEEVLPPGQVAPPMDIEGSDQSTGSDEVFDNNKDSLGADASGIATVSDKDIEMEALAEKSVATIQEHATDEEKSIVSGESFEDGKDSVKNVSEEKVCDGREDETVEGKEDGTEEQKEAAEFVLSDWSPSKSPSCSILRKVSTPSSSERGSRKVSFSEPVVSGESPVREKYHSESLPTSPLICHSYNNVTLTRPGSPGIKVSRGSGYRRRLETSMKKQAHSNLRQRCTGSPSQSPSSQNSYKATQESQLDSVNPIFPDLVNCDISLDCILPQLTSSLWYRGLCQLMKGRNLHTIGDLSALTEVQVNQMPIRCPKVGTVRDALTHFQSSRYGSTPKSQQSSSKSIFVSTTPSLEASRSVSCTTNQGPGTPVSAGATIGQAVTPSSIADEGIKILPSAEQDLSQLSPIKGPNLNAEVSSSPPIVPQSDTTTTTNPSTTSSSSTSVLTPASTYVPQTDSPAEDCPPSSKKSQSFVEVLSSITDKGSVAELKDLSMAQLFDVHQKLNNLFGVVVEVMKERSFQSS